ncbi:MAG: hypothetical protein KJ601_00235 [Nanoarchaeota archaeon]|nr:hypothetical protein [Nanoarchaeota archaeon]
MKIDLQQGLVPIISQEISYIPMATLADYLSSVSTFRQSGKFGQQVAEFLETASARLERFHDQRYIQLSDKELRTRLRQKDPKRYDEMVRIGESLRSRRESRMRSWQMSGSRGTPKFLDQAETAQLQESDQFLNPFVTMPYEEHREYLRRCYISFLSCYDFLVPQLGIQDSVENVYQVFLKTLRKRYDMPDAPQTYFRQADGTVQDASWIEEYLVEGATLEHVGDLCRCLDVDLEHNDSIARIVRQNARTSYQAFIYGEYDMQKQFDFVTQVIVHPNLLDIDVTDIQVGVDKSNKPLLIGDYRSEYQKKIKNIGDFELPVPKKLESNS